MAELRRDPLSVIWVVVGFKKTKTNVVGVCPFCPGNESQTPPSIREVRNAQGEWVVRCFPAANPVFQIEMSESKRADGFYDKMGTVGADELIVDEMPFPPSTRGSTSRPDMMIELRGFIGRLLR